MLELRQMESHEAKEVRQVAVKAFGFEGLFMFKPKSAMIAVLDGKIVGAVIIKLLVTKHHKIGYYNGGFVHPDYHGQGIGSALYRATADHLWGEGCTVLSALVKDDNVASWKPLLNNGFRRTSFFETWSILGFSALLKYYFFTPFFVAIGMESYLATKHSALVGKSNQTTKDLPLYLGINGMLLLVGLIGGGQHIFLYLTAFLTILAVGVLFSYTGTLASKGNWYFRLNTGGGFLCGIMALSGSILPLIGAWYPAQYEDTPAFRRDMGLPALLDWLSLLGLTLFAKLLSEGQGYLHCLGILGTGLLFYKMVAVYPLEAYGGGRVYRWSRPLYIAMALASVSVICFL